MSGRAGERDAHQYLVPLDHSCWLGSSSTGRLCRLPRSGRLTPPLLITHHSSLRKQLGGAAEGDERFFATVGVGAAGEDIVVGALDAVEDTLVQARGQQDGRPRAQ